ncbi:phage holin [Paenibacillus albicereus]|uniref:Phage holin n=1 Tax=Paenibacillus albicereus TaxID=2726185 RepID=A0A6H2GZE6_9BACL|nr:phage holin [Paenibacillus albicereus]QJC52772.1 phage holin [Paenibacillus albicereus]
MTIQPYIDTIVQALVGLLAAAVLAWVATVRKRLDAWLEARTTEQQRAVLHKMAAEAVSYVEATAASQGARNKLEEAMRYLQANLPVPIVASLKDKELRAAVEKALYELKAVAIGPAAAEVRRGQQ